jgi:hypothetical protein
LSIYEERRPCNLPQAIEGLKTIEWVLDVPDQLNVSIAEQEFDRAVSLMKKSMSLNKMPVCAAVALVL